MKHLRQLEDQSVYIFREAYKHFDNLAMLWSMGKDSTVLLWLARQPFFGHVPFPLLHVDTSYKIPAMIEYRDRLAREWGLNLVVGQNKEALAAGMNHTLGRVTCCTALKTNALKQLLEQKGYTGVILGVRADEEGTRAKERYFSPRDKHGDWDFRDQPPELWDQYKTTFPPGTHIRIHPLLDWTEINIWEYIKLEQIPFIDLYLDRGDGTRYRSLGCAPCTTPITSAAKNVDDIIEELRHTTVAERSGISVRALRNLEQGAGSTVRTLLDEPIALEQRPSEPLPAPRPRVSSGSAATRRAVARAEAQLQSARCYLLASVEAEPPRTTSSRSKAASARIQVSGVAKAMSPNCSTGRPSSWNWM